MSKGRHQSWCNFPTPSHQQPTKDLTDDDKDEEESGHTSYYVEHDADVVGELFLVFDVGYQNRRDQKPNCNSKLQKTDTSVSQLSNGYKLKTNLEAAIKKHNFSGWGDGSVGKAPGKHAWGPEPTHLGPTLETGCDCHPSIRRTETDRSLKLTGPPA